MNERKVGALSGGLRQGRAAGLLVRGPGCAVFNPFAPLGVHTLPAVPADAAQGGEREIHGGPPGNAPDSERLYERRAA